MLASAIQQGEWAWVLCPSLLTSPTFALLGWPLWHRALTSVSMEQPPAGCASHTRQCVDVNTTLTVRPCLSSCQSALYACVSAPALQIASAEPTAVWPLFDWLLYRFHCHSKPCEDTRAYKTYTYLQIQLTDWKVFQKLNVRVLSPSPGGLERTPWSGRRSHFCVAIKKNPCFKLMGKHWCT